MREAADIGRSGALRHEKGCSADRLPTSQPEIGLKPTAFLYYYLGLPQITAWISHQAIGTTLPT